jgi:protein-L-isoaspartate(D-aspartate) O-methyltransferase
MTVFEAARRHMVESQLLPNKVTDDRVLDAFARVSRELSVPEMLRPVAYVDQDLPLGRGRFLMEPMVAARLIQAAAPARAETALVVGAGTGYEAVVLSQLTRNVVALEEDPALARQARAALVDENIAAVSVVEGPLAEGWKQRGPYDVVLFAGAIAGVSSEIESQLSQDGRLVAVIRAEPGSVGRATLITRRSGVIARRVIFDAATPFLPGFAPKPAFVF